MARDRRTYIKLHDGMPDHPKIEGLSDGAFRLLIRLWCWCSRHLTNGHVPVATWSKSGTAKRRAELIAAKMVRENPDGSVEMHDYLQHQRSAEEVRELTDTKADAAAAANHVRWHKTRGQRVADCPKCIAEASHDGSQVRSASDRTTIANGSQTDRYACDSTETETETETELVGYVDPSPPVTQRASQTAEGGPTDNPNPNGLGRLIAAVQQIRPGWTVDAIRTAITDASRQHPWPAIGPALLELARLPDTQHPGRLTHDGPWWRTATGPPPPAGIDHRQMAEETARLQAETANLHRQHTRAEQLDQLGERGQELRDEAKAELRDSGQSTPSPLVDRRAIQLAKARGLVTSDER